MIKEYSSGIENVDILDQKRAACKVNRKSSSGRYYFRLIFDLMDMALVNSHIIYMMLYLEGMNLMDDKVTDWLLQQSLPKYPCYSLITSFTSTC